MTMIADYNKTIIKEPRKREKGGGGRKRNGESASDAPSAKRLHVKSERKCGRTGCVRGAYAN